MAPITAEWVDERATLAVVFGVVSVPWTYAFVVGDLPLWTAFVASAAVFAAGGGTRGLVAALPPLVAGALYAAATLAIVGALGGGTLVLAAVVGAFMALASLHAYVSVLSFTPAGFLGYASLFGVHAAEATVFGLAGLGGVTAGTLLSAVVGAHLGWLADIASDRLN
jgi:hypothetical protein